MSIERSTDHPRYYRRRVPLLWWLEKGVYVRFMIRELTCLFVGFAAILLLCEVRALSKGGAAWAMFQARLESPGFLVLNGVVLAMVLYHTVTWFNAAPQALVIKLGGRRVPKGLILAGHYFAWVVVSGVVIWFLRGQA